MIDWLLILWYVGIFFFIVVVHEFGHWLAYRYFGYKPSVRLTCFGVVLMGENVFLWLSPIQAYVIYLAGILLGWIPVILSGDSTLGIAYVFACIIDFVGLLKLLSLGMKAFNSNKPLLVLEQDEIIEYNMKNPDPKLRGGLHG